MQYAKHSLISTTILWDKYQYDSHFTNERTHFDAHQAVISPSSKNIYDLYSLFLKLKYFYSAYYSFRSMHIFKGDKLIFI